MSKLSPLQDPFPIPEPIPVINITTVFPVADGGWCGTPYPRPPFPSPIPPPVPDPNPFPNPILVSLTLFACPQLVTFGKGFAPEKVFIPYAESQQVSNNLASSLTQGVYAAPVDIQIGGLAPQVTVLGSSKSSKAKSAYFSTLSVTQVSKGIHFRYRIGSATYAYAEPSNTAPIVKAADVLAAESRLIVTIPIAGGKSKKVEYAWFKLRDGVDSEGPRDIFFQLGSPAKK